MNNAIFHMGNAVYKEFIKSGLTPEGFADKIGCMRNNVYSIFKRQSINAEQLILISKALNHNFLLDLALLVDESATLTIDTAAEDNEEFNEALVTLPDDKLLTVTDEQYSSIIEEYIVTEHHLPLIVIAYNSPSADDIIYRAAEKQYGSKGYKMMTDTVNLGIKPYMVPVFMEQSERQCGKDLDSQIGEVVAAQKQSDKHLVFIVNIPECRLMFDAAFYALEDEITRLYELWQDHAHVVCLDSTGKLTARRKLKRYGGYTANHIIAWELVTGLTDGKFKDAEGNPFDCSDVFMSVENIKKVYDYLVEENQIPSMDFDFASMTIEKREYQCSFKKEHDTVWIIHYPDFLDPSQDAIKGLVTVSTSPGSTPSYKHFRLITRPKGDYLTFCEGMMCALDPDSILSPRWKDTPSDDEFIQGVMEPTKINR